MKNLSYLSHPHIFRAIEQVGTDLSFDETKDVTLTFCTRTFSSDLKDQRTDKIIGKARLLVIVKVYLSCAYDPSSAASALWEVLSQPLGIIAGGSTQPIEDRAFASVVSADQQHAVVRFKVCIEMLSGSYG
jgi:hypothetical protein